MKLIAAANKKQMEIKSSCAEPASDGFPEGLLDQPFYGWVKPAAPDDEPVLTGFSSHDLLAKAGLRRALKRPPDCLSTSYQPSKGWSKNPCGEAALTRLKL